MSIQSNLISIVFSKGAVSLDLSVLTNNFLKITFFFGLWDKNSLSSINLESQAVFTCRLTSKKSGNFKTGG